MTGPFSADDSLEVLAIAFPEDRLATTRELATFLQLVKQRLDAAGMPPGQQRVYVHETLDLALILHAKMIGDAEEAGAPEYSVEDARATVQEWLDRVWPDEEN
jgi:hypothetical protein